ncbi:MAG: TRAP transporter small permease subunit [Phyllobacteriaceae bacterium]|nr:TRAP transporter small permease subunit [Phyllobacteriaceae bacterium]
MIGTKTEAGGSRPRSFLHGLFQVNDLITKAAFFLSAALLAVIVALYCMEIVLRYFFQSPTIWSRDTIVYLLSGTILLAAPEVARSNGHVAITILVERSNPATQRRMETFLALITTFVALSVVWVTTGETWRLYQSGILTDLTVAVPKWWIGAFVPFGFLLLALQYLALALCPARRGHNKTSI